MQIVDMVYYWARTTPLRPAVIEPEGTLTYAALARGIEAAAEHFARSIPDKSKPVAVWLPHGSRCLVGVLGLLRAGFSVVLAYEAVLDHLPAAGATTLVGERGVTKWAGGTNIEFDGGWIRYGTNESDRDWVIPRPRMKEGAIICFTSGGTGRPRAIVCPQKSWQQRVLFPLNSAFASYERILVVPGLVTSWGLSRGYEALYAGRTVCLAPTEEAMLWIANYYAVDTMLASPIQALALADTQEKITRYSLASLKTLQIAASAIAREGVARIQKYLCRSIIMIYGSTEAGAMAVAPYEAIADIPGAAGFVLPGVEVEVVDETGRVLPPGGEGLVRVRSSVLMENVVDGVTGPDWFYPGDIGRVSDNGLLFISGRITDILNRGGDKFSITDFEQFLSTCPGVRDAGVCTLMGQSGFEEGWIALVLDPAANMNALRHAIQSNATFGKNIDKLFVVDRIPRSTLGKIEREELKAMLQAISKAQTESQAGEAGVASSA